MLTGILFNSLAIKSIINHLRCMGSSASGIEIGNGNICEYGVYVYRQNGKVFLSLCDAENGETAYTEIHNCPMCGRKFWKD